MLCIKFPDQNWIFSFHSRCKRAGLQQSSPYHSLKLPSTKITFVDNEKSFAVCKDRLIEVSILLSINCVC